MTNKTCAVLDGGAETTFRQQPYRTWGLCQGWQFVPEAKAGRAMDTASAFVQQVAL